MQSVATDPDPIDGPVLGTGRERRIEERHSCFWPARCSKGPGSTFDVVVVDASKGGFCVASRSPVAVGDHLTLGLDQIGAFECEVRWVAPDRFGVRIVEVRGHLSGHQVEGLAAFLDPPADGEPETDPSDAPRRSFRYF